LDDERAPRWGAVVENMARFRVRNPDAWLGYELEPLNALVELASSDPKGFEGVQELIDGKRRDKGLRAIWPDKSEERFDKVEYQRILMQERRRRTGRAVDIENMQRPEKDRLVGTKRLEFENRTLARWGEELQTLLDNARALNGGSLTRDQQRAIRDNFWSGVDQKLDDTESEVRRKRLG
jgi:hypothetical protein